MTQFIDRLASIAPDYDAIVLDQWGVLHDGSTAYPGAISALSALHAQGIRLAVLSNSGKRAAPNADRIAAMGFAGNLFECVMTSGEALWRDIDERRIDHARFFPVERAVGDAEAWRGDLSITFTSSIYDADAVLLMGLADGSRLEEWMPLLDQAIDRNLPVYCSNPDKASPRAGGGSVVSPGALAEAYQADGGHVTYYGKPHRPIFDTLKNALACNRLLMVGDSLEHDIDGAAQAGWDSLFVRGGLYQAQFATGNISQTLSRLVVQMNTAPPTHTIEVLQ